MKKVAFLFILSFTLINCGSDSGMMSPAPTPEVKKPVATNDSYTATEDQELIISNLKANDVDAAAATIASIDATGANGGTIVDNRNGTYSYISAKSYVGADTFTYTICDTKTPKNCSTGTVNITVVDEGSPTVEDDAYNTNKNTTITITDVLTNDTLTDDAVLTEVDGSNSSGTVSLDNDIITYTPQNDFVGTDTFTYTICDDDTNQTCVIGTVTITAIESIAFNIPTALVDYYQNMTFSEDADLTYNLLKGFSVAQHTTILSYGQRHTYLYNADEDIANTDNVILMYSGESRYWEEYSSGTNSYSPQTFNTEHVYPQSKLSANDAVTDLHHLRACDANVNSDRSNFSFVDGSGNYKLTGSTWYPGDDWRGDVARMIMYLNVRYGETFDKVGTLALFLDWNIADPVSDFEIQRNNIIESAQGVRNPFIDNPYIATLLWGGADAENKWQ